MAIEVKKMKTINSLLLGTAVSLMGCSFPFSPSLQKAEAQGKAVYAGCNDKDETYELYLTDVTMELKESGSGWTKRYPSPEEFSILKVLHRAGGERLCDRIEPVPHDAEVLVKGAYDHGRDYFISGKTVQLWPEEKLIWPPQELVPTEE